MLQRAFDIANVITALLFLSRHKPKKILDFGGGIGLLARLMRDRGFAFESLDLYCDPIFVPQGSFANDYTMITLIELLEHLENPLETLSALARNTDVLVISTLLKEIGGIDNSWWYLQLETGQHIFFPSEKTMKVLAGKLGFHLCSDGQSFHVLSKNRLPVAQRLLIQKPRIAWVIGYLISPFRRSAQIM